MSERRYGILIACSRFPQEPKLNDLRCPENDVDGLNDVLSSEDRGGFEEIIVMKNRPHYEVLQQINRVLKRAQKNDLVLIYYSGHGKLDLAGRLHLTTVDTEIVTLESTSIPVQSIRNYIDNSSSTRAVLLLDCCYSGAVDKAFLRGNVDEQLQQIARGRGTYIMTASTDIQVAQEKEMDQYGIFTKHLIEGIRWGEADRDGNGEITMDEIYNYVHDKVLEEKPQEPMRWAINVRGDLVISKSGKTPWEDRRRQIRKILLDLASKDILPDQIHSKALDVISLEPSELSGALIIYNDLLDQLIQERVKANEFIGQWYNVVSEQPPAIPKLDTPAQKPIEKAPASKKAYELPKTKRIFQFGILVGLAALLAILGWLYNHYRTRNDGQSFSETPLSSTKVPDENIGVRGLDFKDIEGSFINNNAVGQLFVIEGNVINNNSKARSFILLKAAILDDESKVIRERLIYAGNTFSENDLKTLPLKEINSVLENRKGQGDLNMNIPSGSSIPFMFIFENLPDNLREFVVEAVSASSGE